MKDLLREAVGFLTLQFQSFPNAATWLAPYNDRFERIAFEILTKIKGQVPRLVSDRNNDMTYIVAYMVEKISVDVPKFALVFKAFVFAKSPLCDHKQCEADPQDIEAFIDAIKGKTAMLSLSRVYFAYLRGEDPNKDAGGRLWRWLAEFLADQTLISPGSAPAVLEEFLKARRSAPAA